jgi:DNA-directed RNA polymerase-5 subunit 1
MFIHLDTTNGKLLVVPYVQFSFSDDNTVLSESVEGLVNVIANSVGFGFLLIAT